MAEAHPTLLLELRGGKIIRLADGKRRGENVVGHAIVRDDEFARVVLAGLSWHLTRAGYPVVSRQTRRGSDRYLHHMIFEHYHGAHPAGTYVDHEDKNPLNSTPENLRAVTPSVSSANRNKNRNNKSGYRGVQWNQSNTSWRARVMVNFKIHHLGYFKDVKDAARAVNAAYREHFPGVAPPNPEVG